MCLAGAALLVIMDIASSILSEIWTSASWKRNIFICIVRSIQICGFNPFPPTGACVPPWFYCNRISLEKCFGIAFLLNATRYSGISLTFQRGGERVKVYSKCIEAFFRYFLRCFLVVEVCFNVRDSNSTLKGFLVELCEQFLQFCILQFLMVLSIEGLQSRLWYPTLEKCFWGSINRWSSFGCSRNSSPRTNCHSGNLNLFDFGRRTKIGRSWVLNFQSCLVFNRANFDMSAPCEICRDLINNL